MKSKENSNSTGRRTFIKELPHLNKEKNKSNIININK